MIRLLNGFVQTEKVDDAKRVLTNLMFTHNTIKEASELYEMTCEEKKALYLLWDFLDNVNRAEGKKKGYTACTTEDMIRCGKIAIVKMFNFSCCLYLIWAATVPENLLSVVGH